MMRSGLIEPDAEVSRMLIRLLPLRIEGMPS
jgi:hypothetical protein